MTRQRGRDSFFIIFLGKLLEIQKHKQGFLAFWLKGGQESESQSHADCVTIGLIARMTRASRSMPDRLRISRIAIPR